MTTCVAAAQLRCPANDADARLHATTGAIRAGAAQGADLVILPELAASGYHLEARHLEECAEPEDGSGPFLRAWRTAAAEVGVAVVGGFVERTARGLANAAVVIGTDGAILTTYRKLHLFGGEHDVFIPGDSGLPIVDVAGLRVGVLICYDLRFPEVARILALRDADLIAVPTAWVAGFDKVRRRDGSIGQIDGVVVQANLDQVYIACADQVGAEGDVLFLGRSLVVDAYGGIIAGPLGETDAGFAVATVDAAEVVAARDRGQGISPRANRRVDIYGPVLGYADPDTDLDSPLREVADRRARSGVSRVPNLAPNMLTAEQHALYESIVGGRRADGPQLFRLTEDDGSLVGPFGIMLIAPHVGSALSALGETIRYATSLSPRIRELAILAVAAHWRSEFEWFAHEAIGRSIGFEDAQLGALASGHAPSGISAEESITHDIVSAAVAGAGIPDETWERAIATLGIVAVTEVVALVAYYSGLALLLRAFEVGSPAGAASPFAEASTVARVS
jgi:N-carbamoylputrescine amidase